MRRERSARQLWRLRAVLLCLAVALVGSGGPAVAQPPPQDGDFQVVWLPPGIGEITAADLARADAVAGLPGLDSTMARLARAARTSAAEALDLARVQGVRVLRARVQVQVVTDAAGLKRARAAMVAAGGEVTGAAADGSLIQGWLPVASLEPLAAHPDVYVIQEPALAYPMDRLSAGASTTEGLAVINGPAWHSAGYTGAGVKIAVIDAGFQGYPGLLGTDLPASVTVKNFVDGESDAQVNGGGPHGTACAEIVYDIAPGATLYLAKIATNLDLAEAVAWAKNTHQVDVISTSLGWFNLTPGDGTGQFADLVQQARAAGIVWATAAGNYRDAHWGGAYSDPDSDNYHNFDGTQEINWFGPGTGSAYNIPSGYRLCGHVRWDDWTAVNQDYDLHLMRYSGGSWAIVASSTNTQNGGPGQAPRESVCVTTSGASEPYGFSIERKSGTRAVNFEFFAPNIARLDELLYARSLANLADAPHAMTVAALDVDSPFPQEDYSSEGPTNGPGGTAAGGFTKPDISGYANVSTQSYGFEGFNGTSAATPHVAGAAALVLSAYPGYTPDQVQSFLEGRAIDLGAAGMDTVYGYGRLHLGASPVGSSYRVFLPVVMRNYPPFPCTPVLNPIANPDGDGNYTVSWGAACRAESYTLQEDDSGAFPSPTPVYQGGATSWNGVSKPAGTFCYRVKASNSWGDSGWSSPYQCVTVQPPTQWVTILSDDFEGSFPGLWQVEDLDDDSGFCYWWKRNCRDNGGNYSAWVAGGGDCSGLGCGNDYRNDMSSWMTYGPFSLADATAAELTFDFWLESESGFDYFMYAASIDDNTYYGHQWAGDTQGWLSGSLDLSDVYQLGSLLGEDEVWIAFIFQSDGSVTYEGAFVDNVVLRKMTGGSMAESSGPMASGCALKPGVRSDPRTLGCSSVAVSRSDRPGTEAASP